MSDAKFEDGEEKPLRLMAAGQDDLQVISTMLQDAVTTVGDISWMPRKRQAAMLLNRFRWEDEEAAQRQKRVFERVRSLLLIEDATSMQSSGIDARDREVVLSLLSVHFEGDENGGKVNLTFAGDVELAVSVEAVNVTLTDVSRPYAAPSRSKPKHE